VNKRSVASRKRETLTHPLIARILRSPSAPFPGRTLTAQNRLLARYPGDLGGKTGFTNLARKTYVGAAQRGDRRLVVVQMYGSGDLYDQAISLLEWGFGQSGQRRVRSGQGHFRERPDGERAEALDGRRRRSETPTPRWQLGEVGEVFDDVDACTEQQRVRGAFTA
jgi:D-alanyl-D-alanine carboxypeptidase